MAYSVFRWYRSTWGRVISQRELDQMDCCQLMNEIHTTRMELLRSRQNQDSPAKRLRHAKSAFEYAKNYVDRRTDYRNRQKRLRDLLREFDDKNCDPRGIPHGTALGSSRTTRIRISLGMSSWITGAKA